MSWLGFTTTKSSGKGKDKTKCDETKAERCAAKEEEAPLSAKGISAKTANGLSSLRPLGQLDFRLCWNERLGRS